MRTSQPANATKLSWFIVFASLVFSIGIYGLMCFFILQSSTPRLVSPTLETIKPVFILLGFAVLAASVTWLRLKVDGKIGGEGRPVRLSPAEFQTHSIIALSLSEACAILGLALFFLGAPIEQFGIFAFGTVFIDLAFILPRGMRFWSNYNKS